MKTTSVVSMAAALAIGSLLVSSSRSSISAQPQAERAAPPAHDIQVTPWGPSPELVESTKARLDREPAVRAVLQGTRHRMLSFVLLDDEDDKTQPPSRYEATFFDYTRNRAYVVSGRFGSRRIQVARSHVQPLPSDDEFDDAVRRLQRDPRVGPALREGRLKAFPPMPPLINDEARVEETPRTVAVGLLPADVSLAAADPAVSGHEIVGVNMIRSATEAFANRAPETALVTAAACGIPNASQSTTSRGTSGSFNVVIRRGGVELWNFVAVRPSASSGRRGSGLELRSVRYRGKSVLARAHVPILNVQYVANQCGPYRDWQYQEGSFAADGTNVASGVRRTVTPPQTIVDNGTDTGNFRGLAFHDDGTSVFLATEMQAGWYRYVMKWILKDDGTIQPRFAFGGVQNSCICNIHNHHAYWRFDFDVVQAGGNSVCVSEAAGQACTDVATEKRLAAVGSHLEVRNALGTGAYRLVPGAHDGMPDPFSKATAWILADASNQTDDGVNCTSGRSCHTDIDIDKFMNGQSVQNRDVVVWYRGSFVHDESGTTEGEVHTQDHDGSHTVGPDLIPVGW